MAMWIRLTRFRDGQPLYLQAGHVLQVEDDDPAADVPEQWAKMVPTFYKGVRTRIVVWSGNDYNENHSVANGREEVLEMVLQATAGELFNPIKIEGRKNR